MKFRLPVRPKPVAAASTVVLEVSPRSAKVMMASGAPAQISRVNASTLSDQAPDPVAALRALLDAQPLGTREVGLLFGREAFGLQTLELPSMDSKELASMLELQLGKLTPYPRAEILSAHTIVGSFREGYTTVLLAIARKTLIDGVLQVLKTKGISPAWASVSTEGLEAWWAACGRQEAQAAGNQLTVIIDVDFSSTDCAILSSNGGLLFTHSIPIGFEQLSADEPSKLRWIGELVRLPRILLHENVQGSIGRGILTGVTDGLQSMVEQLTSQWGVAVEIKDPLAPVGCSDTVRTRAKVMRVSYAALSGVLASGRAPRVDLLPRETRVHQALQVRSKHLARLAWSLAAVLILATVFCLERVIVWQGYLAQLRRQLDGVERTAGDVTQQQQAMRRIRAWLDPSRSVLEVLRAVASAAGSEIAITQLSYTDAEPVKILGKASGSGEAYAFIDRLKQTGVFAAVHSRSVASKAKGAGSVGAEFEIVCELPNS